MPSEKRGKSAANKGTKLGKAATEDTGRNVPHENESRSLQEADAFPIVGIGASAGGLEAFSELLRALPCDTGMGFVLVQHLDPAHESALTEILKRATLMPVCEVNDNMRVEPNCVYVIPPNRELSISMGILKLSPRRTDRGMARSIDSFFESLAADRGKLAIGVILSGTASDGTKGVEAIKGEGGIALAQDESAKYDSMPRSAINAGCIDFVLSPKEIAAELARLAVHPYLTERVAEALRRRELEGGTLAKSQGGPGEEAWHKDFRRILIRLRDSRGIDFSLYKPSTVERRIHRRMVLHKLETLKDYDSYLRANPKEIDHLYSDILIGVTGFFRNPEAYQILQERVFPTLERPNRGEPFRFWAAGCSTGQEAYSLAMAYAEFTDGRESSPKLQIFGTDLNEAWLETARAGIYPRTLVNDVSPERLERFFVEENGGYRVRKSLRQSVVFAHHNLVGDPPFSRMDLVACRNLMIYLEGSLQHRLLSLLHYSLKPNGILFLGASESAGALSEFFDPVDKKWKIFRKKAGGAALLPVRFSPGNLAETDPAPAPQSRARPETVSPEGNAQREADRVTVNRFSPPGVLIDSNCRILQFRGATGAYLEPPTGTASFQLLKMARKGLMLPLRSAIDEAKKENREVRRENVQIQGEAETRTITVEVVPLKNLNDQCYLVLFQDAEESSARTAGKRGPEPAAQATRRRPATTSEKSRIDALERELAETRDYLQSIQEQHEASSEELQASNEEVQSANEELQSINEELETSKEELESTNEELTTVNEEMANRNVQLDRVNSDLVNLQASVNTAIVLLARDLTVRHFTPLAERTFNLLASDIGRSKIGRIKVNFETPDLESWVREVIGTASCKEREVQDKNQRWYSLRARPYLNVDNEVDGAVLMLVDIDNLKRSERDIKKAQDFADAIVSQVSPLVILDEHLRVQRANESFFRHFDVTCSETEGRLIYELGNGQWDIPELRDGLERILPQQGALEDFEVEHDFERIGPRILVLNARRLDHLECVLLHIVDLTAQRTAERSLKKLNSTLEDRVAQRTAEVEKRIAQLQQVSLELADTENRERRRLAVVLHDDLQQILVAAQMQVRAALGDDSTSDKAKGVLELLSHAVDTTRSLARELAPPVLYSQGLGAALHWLAGWSRDRYNLSVEVVAEEAAEPENHQLRVLLFEEVRELLLNVVKHSGTNRARVRMTRAADSLRLEVEDFGHGFDPEREEGGEGAKGSGLQSIKERLLLLGGEIKVDSAPSRGTRVEIIVPLLKGTSGKP